MKTNFQQITQTSDTGNIFDVPLPVAGVGLGLAAILAVLAYLNMRRHK